MLKVERLENDFQDLELEDFDNEMQQGYADNMFCDNYGYCCGTSCRNYWKCQG